jgi:hypothetical protein
MASSAAAIYKGVRKTKPRAIKFVVAVRSAWCVDVRGAA